MRHLKLVVNNKSQAFFFNKKELKVIFNLYAKMVSNGQWKDYGLSLSKNDVSFNIYKRFTDHPIFKITKNFTTKSKNGVYSVNDNWSNNTFRSNNLNNLINKVNWNKLRLVK